MLLNCISIEKVFAKSITKITFDKQKRILVAFLADY